MKPLLIKCLKVFLIVAVGALVILLVFGAVFALDWPWWMGIFILMGIVGLGIGLLFVRKIWLRRREQLFVHEVIEQDEAYIKGLEIKEKEPLKELQNRWKEALEKLRRSHLRKYGNPLYVLPWYLIIGESGSGKTTAITSARLSSPFAEVSRTSGISGTRNCDWWFFDQAIILDTAGRYAIPIDESRDKEEWRGFLNLLVKYRKKESLNGLIVTIAGDKLFQSDRETLEEDGRDIRRRIDELMRVLGAKFPVYLLVTKCDLIQGMTQFCDHLPEKRLEQPMGCVNQDLTRDVFAFQEQTNDTISDHLRDFRLLMLHQSPGEGVDPSFLLFPEEFEKLKPGLGAFIKGAFQETPYQETPILRGIFFSSGRQEGTPYSHFLRALGLIGEGEVLPGTSKGLFLHDFFAKVLPIDRGLFAPTQRALELKRISRNLGLSSWIALGVALCGLLSFSLVKNLKTLREVPREYFRQPPALTGDFVADMGTMENFRGEVLEVEEANRAWWIPRFGLTHSLKAETTLKGGYCKKFREFLASFDRELEARIPKVSGAGAPKAIGQYVEHLSRRFGLLKARLGGEDLEDLRGMPWPSCQLVLADADPEIVEEINGKFRHLYGSYLIWRPLSVDGFHEDMNGLQARLDQRLGQDLKWLVAWGNRQDSLPDVTMEDFWKGSVPVSKKVIVQRAFTREGKKRLDGFLGEIQAALPDPGVIASRKEEFERWYQKEYVKAWGDFARYFPEGENGLRGRRDRQQVAEKMASGEGPYSTFLDTMADELEPVTDVKDLPLWVDQLYRFQFIKAQALGDQLPKEKGLLEKATQKGKRFLTRFEKRVSKVPGKPLRFEKEAFDAYMEYRNALVKIVPAAESRRVSYDLTAQAFGEDPTTSKAPFFIAQKGLEKLKSAVSAGDEPDKIAWKLIRGPFDYLWSFVVSETGCELQTEWGKSVLAEIEGLPPAEAQQLVLGKDGRARKFVDGGGPAAPFIGRVPKKGYIAKKVLGIEVPFTAEFLRFLNYKPPPPPSQYRVTIKGLPTNANPRAKRQPHETRLQLKCESGVQSLRNLNYPTGGVFKWSPDTCSDVIFEIDVGGVTLIKKYPGDMGFREFLLDFPKGRRKFYPREFPGEEHALRDMGIQYINVEYEFRGHSPVIHMPRPVKIPRRIVACWGQ